MINIDINLLKKFKFFSIVIVYRVVEIPQLDANVWQTEEPNAIPSVIIVIRIFKELFLKSSCDIWNALLC